MSHNAPELRDFYKPSTFRIKKKQTNWKIVTAELRRSIVRRKILNKLSDYLPKFSAKIPD